MKEGDKVTVVNPLHAYCGRSGTVVEISSDDEGDFIFVEMMDIEGRYAGRFSQDIMFEPRDLKIVK